MYYKYINLILNQYHTHILNNQIIYNYIVIVIYTFNEVFSIKGP